MINRYQSLSLVLTMKQELVWGYQSPASPAHHDSSNPVKGASVKSKWGSAPSEMNRRQSSAAPPFRVFRLQKGPPFWSLVSLVSSRRAPDRGRIRRGSHCYRSTSGPPTCCPSSVGCRALWGPGWSRRWARSGSPSGASRPPRPSTPARSSTPCFQCYAFKPLLSVHCYATFHFANLAFDSKC